MMQAVRVTGADLSGLNCVYVRADARTLSNPNTGAVLRHHASGHWDLALTVKDTTDVDNDGFLRTFDNNVEDPTDPDARWIEARDAEQSPYSDGEEEAIRLRDALRNTSKVRVVRVTAAEAQQLIARERARRHTMIEELRQAQVR